MQFALETFGFTSSCWICIFTGSSGGVGMTLPLGGEGAKFGSMRYAYLVGREKVGLWGGINLSHL
jgi:hypothetical protein